MEANTVVLSLKRYQELYDLEKSIQKSEFYVTYSGLFGSSWTKIFTKDELIKELTDNIVELKERIKELENPPKPEPKTVSIDVVKFMTVREFKRFRKE